MWRRLSYISIYLMRIKIKAQVKKATHVSSTFAGSFVGYCTFLPIGSQTSHLWFC